MSKEQKQVEDTGGGSDTGRQGSQSGGTDGDSSDGQGEGVDGEVQEYGYQGSNERWLCC